MKATIRDREGTTKRLLNKDFAEHPGELSGAICLKTLVLPGTASWIVQKTLCCCSCDFFGFVIRGGPSMSCAHASYSVAGSSPSNVISIGVMQACHEHNASRCTATADMIACLTCPVVTYISLLQVLQKSIPPESHMFNSPGPCSRHWKVQFSEKDAEQRQVNKICNISGNEFPHQFFLVCVDFSASTASTKWYLSLPGIQLSSIRTS